MERGVQTGAHIGQEERRTCMAAIEVRVGLCAGMDEAGQ